MLWQNGPVPTFYFPCLLPHLQIKLQCSLKTSFTRSNTLSQPVFSTESARPQISPFARLKLSSIPGLPKIHLQGWTSSSRPPLHLQGCKLLQNPKIRAPLVLFQSVLLTHFLSLPDPFPAILPLTAPTSSQLPLPEGTLRNNYTARFGHALSAILTTEATDTSLLSILLTCISIKLAPSPSP